MLDPEKQQTILSSVRELTAGMDRETQTKLRHDTMLGVIIALRSIEESMCPVAWFTAVMGGRVQRLFAVKRKEN